MAYQYGATASKQKPAISIENDAIRTREQILLDVEGLILENRQEAMKLKGLRTRAETCRREQDAARERLAVERAKVGEVRGLVRDAEREAADALAAAQREAALILVNAERQCALIRETAHQQARALHDDAHRAGFKRGREQAIARTAARKHAA